MTDSIPWKADLSQIIRIGAHKFCYDCGCTVNTDRDKHLFSRPNIFHTRHRCEKCGVSFQRFLKSEAMESWRNIK